MYQLKITCPKERVGFIEALFEGQVLSISAFEESEDSPTWIIHCLMEQKTEFPFIDGLDYTWEQLPQKDWLSENRASFKPISVGRFFIYPSHYDGEIPHRKIALKIDAARAFGTGEHATTQLCLQALESIEGKASQILDLGTGTGVLAMAAEKLFPDAQILATDNDPHAIDYARHNACENACSLNLQVADGMNHGDITSRSPFDLILANILLRPLVEMAHDLKNSLTPHGKLILSGFTSDQSQEIEKAYAPLKISQRYEKSGWIALLLSGF